MTIKKYRHYGFTIVEMMAVIMIVGLLSVILFIAYSGLQTRAVDASILSDLDHIDAVEVNYGVKNNVAGKAYYSGNGYDSDLGFTPTKGNIVDVVINSTDYCIRAYNPKGSKNSISNAYIKESTTGACNSIPASDIANGATTPRSAGTLADDSSTGSITWTNPTNAAASDNVYSRADMGVDFTMGAPAISRPNGLTTSTYTMILKSNPATTTGTLNSVSFFYNTAATGVIVGTFYGSGTSWTSRGYTTIGSVSAGVTQTFTGLNIPVVAGDYLGFYSDTGSIRMTSASIGYFFVAGNKFGAGTTTYGSNGGTLESISVSATGRGTQLSHYLKATNFGFSIPAGSTINGIQADIESKATGTANENSIRIVKPSGGFGTTNKSTGAAIPSSEAYVTYGGATDLWGETWTAADINNANFGVGISTAGTGIVDVDHIRIRIYYTSP